MADKAAVEYNPTDEASDDPVLAVKARHEDKLMQIPGVVGVGLGRSAIGDPAIIVYTQHQDVSQQLPKSIENLDVIIEVTGDIEAYRE